MEHLSTIFTPLTALLVLGAIANGVHMFRVKRLAGGENVSIEEFPYQVSLRYNNVIHICGGALISERHVLTAAHCVCGLIDEPYEDLTVRTGTDGISAPGDTYAVENITCHRDYEFGLGTSWENDLVVITLLSSVPLTQSQSVIALPTADTDADVRAVITGWGRSTPHSPLHKKLQKLSVNTLDNAACQKHYNNTIQPSQICTLEAKGVGACKGDSGSPLVADGVLIGIFSWTKPCALGSPDVFSRVYHFVDFIKCAMEQS